MIGNEGVLLGGGGHREGASESRRINDFCWLTPQKTFVVAQELTGALANRGFLR
jgi:hypothetical protein